MGSKGMAAYIARLFAERAIGLLLFLFGSGWVLGSRGWVFGVQGQGPLAPRTLCLVGGRIPERTRKGWLAGCAPITLLATRATNPNTCRRSIRSTSSSDPYVETPFAPDVAMGKRLPRTQRDESRHQPGKHQRQRPVHKGRHAVKPVKQLIANEAGSATSQTECREPPAQPRRDGP